MEWIKIKKYKTDGEIICRSEDIDYISSCNNDIATLHLKNGEYFTVELANLLELLRNVEKIQKNTLYGMSVARPLPDLDPDLTINDVMSFQKDEIADHKDHINHLKDEIKDLKLENDRLKRRNELMEDYIHAVACIKSKKSKFNGLCDDVQCPYYDYDKGFGPEACTLGSREWIEQEAADIIEKLEEL